MRAALVGEQEAGARDDGRRAGAERGPRRLARRDPARGEHGAPARELERARQEGGRRLDAEQVAARLEALGDEPVGAVGQRAPGLLGRADLLEDEDPASRSRATWRGAEPQNSTTASTRPRRRPRRGRAG